jgi:nucleotide-binding universal stress UspA family protein
MFKKILQANDGSEPAFKAFALAVDVAERNGAELHMVCVEEIPPMPDAVEEVRQTTATAGRRFHSVVQRARVIAERGNVPLHPHVLAGHPVRTVVDLASELGADLLIIGATGHSAIYKRMIGSRADRIIHLSPCPVLVVK